MRQLALLPLIVLLTACSVLDVRPGEPAPRLEVSHVKQLYPASCGIAALSSVAKYWGEDLEQEQVYRKFPPKSSDGYSVGELKTLARGRGFHAFGLEADMAFLEKQLGSGRPVLVALSVDARYLSWLTSGPVSGLLLSVLSPQYDHFVIVTGFDQRHVWLVDPVLGDKRVSRRQFEAMWRLKRNATLLVAK